MPLLVCQDIILCGTISRLRRMKKVVLGLMISLLLLVGGGVLYAQSTKGAGALIVKSNVKSKVYLDEKLIGTTPLCAGNSPACKENKNKSIPQGNYLIKVVPEDSSLVPFAARIDIYKDVFTVVERAFLPTASAHAHILTFEKIPSKNSQLLITSMPKGALVFIDGSLHKETTPFLLKSLSAGVHEIQIQKHGFAKKTIKLQTRANYKLVVNAILGTEVNTIETPPPTTTAAPLPIEEKGFVKITDTPTGFLRVRAQPSIQSEEVNRAYPQDIIPYHEENEEWFKIQLKDGTMGWVSKSYAEKIINPQSR